MRNRFVNWLVSRAEARDDIFLLTADLGYSVLEPFAERFPDRFINVGVAEQNMVGVASGLSLEGLCVYTYSIGIFPTFRCAEQLRNDVDYHRLPVVSCMVGSGVAYGNLGYSHHAIQDLALMRSLPNTVIATPADPDQVEQTLEWHESNPCPLYLRLHKANEQPLGLPKQPLSLGGIYQVWPDPSRHSAPQCSERCVLVIGHMASKVISVMQKLGSQIPVFVVPLWGTPATSELCQKLSLFKKIYTVEDHVLAGGFGSYVMEVVSKASLGIQVTTVALDTEVIGRVAREDTLLAGVLNQLECLLRLEENADPI